MEVNKMGILDRVINLVSPETAARRMAFRALGRSSAFQGALTRIKNFAGKSPYYRGGRKGRMLGDWITDGGSADDHLKLSLDDLRNDSNDLIANNAIASGAIDTYCTNVVGTGIDVYPTIDFEYLGMSEDEAEAWSAEVEREWKLFSKNCDVTRSKTMSEIFELVLRSMLTDGDIFCNLPMIEREGIEYKLCLNLIEGARISSVNGVQDTDRLSMGVELDEMGCPIGYQYSESSTFGQAMKWKRLKAFDDNGEPLILHIFRKKRVGQHRGIPILAPVIELIKKLDTYSQAEVSAAVINSFFTVFVKKRAVDEDENPLDVASKMGGETGASSSDSDITLAEGNVVDLHQDEEGVEFADPTRPNVNYDAFFQSVIGEIALGLNMPKEVLIKAFQSSYSASKGAVIEATKVFDQVESYLVGGLGQPVYEAFLFEAVTTGRISAPGFVEDPLRRQAFCGSTWVGPAQNELDPMKGAKAAQARKDAGISNDIIEAARAGRSYSRIQMGVKRAQTIRVRAGTEPKADENEE